MEQVRKVTKTEVVEVVDKFTCNKCEKVIQDIADKFDFSHSPARVINSHNGLNISHEGGYASKIGDGVIVDFDLCEDCLIDLISSFKIPADYKEAGWLEDHNHIGLAYKLESEENNNLLLIHVTLAKNATREIIQNIISEAEISHVDVDRAERFKIISGFVKNTEDYKTTLNSSPFVLSIEGSLTCNEVLL